MTLQELRKTGRDGVYDPVTDEYYFVGEEPKAAAVEAKLAEPIATIAPVEPAAPASDKKTGAVTDGASSKKTEKDKRDK